MTNRHTRLLVVDNYDSFTYNLVQYCAELGAHVEVFRNDEVTLEQLEARGADALMISPGPCDPPKAGISMAAIKHFAGKLPILGVCLGHQSVGAVFGAKVVRAKALMHGKVSAIEHNGEGVFAGLPSPYVVNRYHSLAIDPDSVPPELMVTARTADGEIMGIKHRTMAIEGVQFHPESILSEHGYALLSNFLNQARVTQTEEQAA